MLRSLFSKCVKFNSGLTPVRYSFHNLKKCTFPSSCPPLLLFNYKFILNQSNLDPSESVRLEDVFFSVSNDIEEKDYAFHPRKSEDGKGGWKAAEWRDSCPGRGFALNGGGGRASEIKRPVDGLFSCAVMYDLPPSPTIFHPLLASLSSLFLEGEGRDLPRRPGQFRCDKEVDRDGRYAASSLSLRVYKVCVCVWRGRARTTG